MMKRIWIFGDSILRGVVWSESAGRYINSDKLGEKELACRYSMEIVNRSRFGCTLVKGTKILQKQFESAPICDAALLEYGGNDCDFNWADIAAAPTETHSPNTPLDTFEALYRETVQALKAKGTLPVLCNLVPVCADRYLAWITRTGLSKENILRWLGDENAIYRFQERYSRKIEEIAIKENCPLIDLRGAFLSVRQMENLFCADGIHPNEQGQALICNTFASAIDHSRILFPKNAAYA
ncbi:MAG: SGNH/GDSL hydrolase family protein [Clostridia bacterium]|nr:SGNH/GDSL hydrolase family protein [Clostridia bacterium]